MAGLKALSKLMTFFCCTQVKNTIVFLFSLTNMSRQKTIRRFRKIDERKDSGVITPVQDLLAGILKLMPILTRKLLYLLKLHMYIRLHTEGVLQPLQYSHVKAGMIVSKIITQKQCNFEWAETAFLEGGRRLD